MSDHPISRAMFAWNHGTDPIRSAEAGYVGVCTHPDQGQLPKTDFWNAPLFSFREEKEGLAKSRGLQLKMMVEAWHMACRDKVPLKKIHEAFMSIPEYRDLLSENFVVK